MLEKNFWSIQNTNRFEFTPTLRLVDLLGWGSKNAATKFLDKLKWREIRSTWSVDLKTTGEDFTFAQLYDDQGVTPFQYYLYGLGFGTGFHARNPIDFVTGDMTQTERSDYENFAEYRSRTVDTVVYTQSFQHAVVRRATMGTNFTLPLWETAVSIDGQWSEEFKQPRSTPLFLDTTTVWPKVGVGVSVPNLTTHFTGLRSYLKTLGTSHRTDYTFTRSVTPFQNSEDEWRTEWAFAPLLRLSALTNKDIRIDNDVNFSYGYSLRRPKVQVVVEPNFPNITGPITDTTDYFYESPWIYTDSNQTWTYNWGDELSIGYDLKTTRGFQIFKWYWRLKNDINLKLNIGYSYEMTKNREVAVDPNYTPFGDKMSAVSEEAYILVPGVPVYYPSFISPEPAQHPTNTWNAYIRPNAGYQINKMASMSSFIEYRYTREKFSEGGAHSVQVLQFEIALMLRFD
jgi:cell surface protein SprA